MRGRTRVKDDPLQLNFFSLAAENLNGLDALTLPNRPKLSRERSEASPQTTVDKAEAGAPDEAGQGDERETSHSTKASAINSAVLLPPIPEPDPLRNQNNHRITDADKIGTGSLKQKCRNNLAAIELLLTAEAQGMAVPLQD